MRSGHDLATVPSLIAVDESPAGYSWQVALQQSPLPLHQPELYCPSSTAPDSASRANGAMSLNRLSQPGGPVQLWPKWRRPVDPCGFHRPQNRLQSVFGGSEKARICLKRLVGERGFEPPTPWSRTRCSTRLSHSPTNSFCARGTDCAAVADLIHATIAIIASCAPSELEG